MTPDERAQILVAQSDAALMRDWRYTQAHDVYIRHLDAALAGWTERLLAGDAQQFPYLRGVIEGLRIARQLPATIEAHAKRVAAAE